MTMQTFTDFVPIAEAAAPERSRGCCETGQKSSQKKWLMFAAVTLLAIGLVTGSAVLGFAAIAPLLYVLPCLAMCGMCLFKR